MIDLRFCAFASAVFTGLCIAAGVVDHPAGLLAPVFAVATTVIVYRIVARSPEPRVEGAAFVREDIQ